MIRYNTRCYFNVRSKADISQLNLPQGGKFHTFQWESRGPGLHLRRLYAPMFCSCTCHLLMHVFFVFCTFFCQDMCIMFFVWAATYDGLMPPLAACHCNSWYVLSMLCRPTWQINSLSLSLSQQPTCLPFGTCCRPPCGRLSRLMSAFERTLK